MTRKVEDKEKTARTAETRQKMQGFGAHSATLSAYRYFRQVGDIHEKEAAVAEGTAQLLS
jgi:hypothetical protein